MDELRRYRTVIMDSARWWSFEFRPGDIVISTPPKCGTTWTQMLCALLIFDSTSFYAPLSRISPWLDMQLYAPDELSAALAAQEHRRFIKTHTPLDGLPYDERATYLCVGRDPRDAFVSWTHHMANMNIDAFLAVRAAAVGLDDLAELDLAPPLPGDSPDEKLRNWMTDDHSEFGTLRAALHHYRTFWDRSHEPNVALFHYSDLQRDLRGEMRRLADVLRIDVSDARLDELAASASFAQMKRRAEDVAPNAHHEIWFSTGEFFHRGSSGQWRDVLDDVALERYNQRVSTLAPPAIIEWAHHGRRGATRSMRPAQAGR